MKNYSIFKHSFCTLSLFIVMLLHAGVTYAQEKLRISFSNVSLEEALKKIESASKYTFFYDDKRTDLSQKVSANANGQSIEEVLNAMLKTTNLTYEIDNRQIALIIKEKNGISQKSKKISGVVKDENNEPVIGVSIVQRNTTNGTITDLDGRFSMELPENSSIEISYVGYGKQIIPVANKSNFDIVLKENSLNLDEVVVVGYASRKVEDITGAVSNIRADKTNIGGASTSVDQMLSGRISGVQFKQNTSQPGGGGKTIIRGRNSLFLNTDPLYVVDGFVVNTPSAPSSGMAFNAPDRDPLNSINPNDIESIAVLKDAAATAIYGAQGSNGVFIITTKRGKQGKIRISYDGYAGVQTVANEYDVMNAQQYMRYNNAFNLTSFTEQEINAAQATNWFDQVTRNGFLQSHNVNLSGGSESLKYYFSLGYYGMDGIVKNTGMDRYTGRSNIEYKKDKFTFSSNIFATHILDTNQPTEGGTRNSVISSSIAFAPNVTVRDQNGAYNKDPNNDFIANPVSLLDINDKIYTDKLNFNAGASYEVLPGLKPEIKLTYDVQNAHRSFYVPSTTAYNGNFTHGGTASQSSMRSTGISFDGLLHYDAVFNKKHHVTGLLGYEYYQRDNNYFRAENSGFGTDATHENNLGGGNAPKMSSSKDRRKDISGFGRVDYSFDDKYLATVTLRRDGSSVFGGNNKYAYFPGVSVGWKIDKEDFMAGAADKVDILKLRLGYGQSGNSGIDPYQSLSKYDMTTNGILGQNKVSGATLTNYMENPDLKWETTSQVNLGIDYGFFSRLSGNLDFFVKNTKDMLVQVSQSPMTGHKYQWQNAASMRVWGLEYSLNSTNIQTRDFEWDTQLSFSWTDNKITDYNVTDESTVAALNTIGVIKGERTNSYYTYVIDGIDPSSGSYRFKDLDGDGSITVKDKAILGTPDPRVILGFGNTFKYKNFALDIFFNANFGNKMYNYSAMNFTLPNTFETSNYMVDAMNYWSESNPNSDIAANRANGNGNALYNSRWIEDAWFIRLQNVTLSYNLASIPSLRKIFPTAKIYVQAQNLFLITPYSGLDPELANNAYMSSSENLPAFLPGSVDMNAYPPARTFTVGLNFSF